MFPKAGDNAIKDPAIFAMTFGVHNLLRNKISIDVLIFLYLFSWCDKFHFFCVYDKP